MKQFLNRLRNVYDFALRRRSTLFCKDSRSAPSTAPNVFASILSPFEEYVVSLQSLLIWEKPYLSAASFVALNCLFWLVVSWNRKFLSILSIATLFIFVYRTWVMQIWPEIRLPPPEGEDVEGWTPVNPQVLSVPELGRYMKEVTNKLAFCWAEALKLRQDHHGMFCLFGCLLFTMLAFIGHTVPGVIIIYCLVLTLSLGPGIALHLVPASLYDQLVGLFMDDSDLRKEKSGEQSSKGDSDSDPFAPPAYLPDLLRQLSASEMSQTGVSRGTVMETENPDDNHMATIRELGMDSFACESESLLYAGLGGFPSVEEENESDLEEDLPLEAAAARDNTAEHIKFVVGHFKEDSSESENDIFTEGLSFTNQGDELDTTKPLNTSETATQNITEVEDSLVASDFDVDLADYEVLEQSDLC